MKRRIALATLLAAALGGVPPVAAKMQHAAVSCRAVQEALASGKTKEAVAAQMKTSTATVEKCQADTVGAGKHAKKPTK